jgi:hypothetical protein
MQVRIPTRDCRAAVGAALVALEAKVAKDRQTIWDRSFNSLKEGAVHNGLVMGPGREQEMREMVDRDIEHMMKSHPGVEVAQQLTNYIDMLAYHKGDDVVLDDGDFFLLKPHLPAAAENKEAA